ncbi:MAG: DUF1178 family protein [Parvularculaceae bacterium]
MIKYQLRCDAEHEFEGWFRSSAEFDAQAADGLFECPVCGSSAISKAIMAPAVARRDGGRAGRLAEIRKTMTDAATRARDYVEKNFDYVGEEFPEEARKIHYGEVKARGIYGEASKQEVRELVEEGVEVAPIPGTRLSENSGQAKPGKKTRKKAVPKKSLN